MNRGRGGAQKIPRPPTIRPGPAAAWAGLPPDAVRLPLAEVRRRCLAFPAPPQTPYVSDVQAAAVLVPLFESDGETRVVLTRRPDTMPSHRGDVAFPGGKVHPGIDATLRDAALREAEEEIGLPRSAVEVVAELDTISTVTSRFLVAPFVGVLAAPPELRPDPREVERVFDVALSELMGEGVHRVEQWGTGVLTREVHIFELEDETVWGLTARILSGFLTLITGV
ncbi:MAG TPA: CoA pyrophosphatase [Acidimicrobiia bacterium]|nr:CoA pyrophosphatase [Acidimicrobiia bacterium]